LKKTKKTEVDKLKAKQFSNHLAHGLKEGALIGLVALCIYLLLAFISYDANDPGWSYSGNYGSAVTNSAGLAGAWFADVFLSLLGFMAYLFPLMLAYRAWLIFRERNQEKPWSWPLFTLHCIGFVLVMVAGTALATIYFDSYSHLMPASSGGILGQSMANTFLSAFNSTGSTLVLLAMFTFGLTVFAGISWLRLMDFVGGAVLELFDYIAGLIRHFQQARKEKKKLADVQQVRKRTFDVEIKKGENRAPPMITAPPPTIETSKRVELERQGALFQTVSTGELPPVSLLDKPSVNEQKKGFSKETLEAMSRLLELKLNDFGISVEVMAVQPGPVVTRFEIQPAPGVKVSRITNLAKDLARSLAVISVRVVEVIPGKSVVGIEIPNEDRQIVRLSEIIASTQYDESKSPLTLALGHDIGGLPVVADLAKMPHLLIAGTTGSGKSVGVNAMLISLLFKSSPEEVRLIMIDPKMLELSIYDGIPHLLAPVITDMKEAANGLRWCVGEMERRYKLMAALGVRNISGCNRKIKNAAKTDKPLLDPLWNAELSLDQKQPELQHLPYIVVVIDEFADMMMIVGKKVEELITRIAQKARAAGIHLILATQRPSVDVITGLIKANIPTRIAFQVSSKIDSRTILDQGGAEQLLGHGDMLYLPAGSGVPVRVHGAFVADGEVHRVVNDWASRGEAVYVDQVLEGPAEPIFIPGSSEDNGGDAEQDELYDQAVQFVIESRRASISAVQRKLKIGYNRAARMVESMEAAGVVTEMGRNGSREVLSPPSPAD
jgi:S-DNA-T family DNA segregation ATPase FtsK/SpoIIIE